MSYEKRITCDECGRQESLEADNYGDRPLGPSWRRLKHIGYLRRDESDTEDHEFCSLRCVSAWAARRADVEERVGA